ncbi:MAG: type II/IV secretion system protein [Parachlamydiales bacterium]|nr:type II/IV secretion system protein [Parachlamydiales bacterium]
MKDTIISYPLVAQQRILVPYQFAHKNKLLPLKEESALITVAVLSEMDTALLDELSLMLNKEIRTVVFSVEEIDKGIALCYHPKQQKPLSSPGKEEKREDSVEEYDLLEEIFENPGVQFLNTIISDAIQRKASDIHLEPQEKKMDVRLRIDGILQPFQTIPLSVQQQIVTRIKVMAKLDIAEKRLPQDGRIKLKMGEKEIDFRISIIPVIYGERVTMRILDRSHLSLGLSQLGMPMTVLFDFRQMIQRREGIVLVTGPTGSGKTTSLYSALLEIASSAVNIMTIEDPVEFKLEKIAQIGVNKKIDLTFAKGLRHILRQDPDIIMVGEIRDKETAQIAVQAALTGHLVLSTLHTNDAPSAITRLVDMGIEPFLLSSCLIGVLAQRLVRTLCVHCKASFTLEEATGQKIQQRGCPECFHTGYLGRTGVYELMKITSSIRRQIVKSSDAEDIRALALKEGMVDLHQSATCLVQEGMTTAKEAFRVISAGEV